jgi:hypothetical protein
MSDRDHIAGVVLPKLTDVDHRPLWYRNAMSYEIADALIAAGVTIPAPITALKSSDCLYPPDECAKRHGGRQ